MERNLFKFDLGNVVTDLQNAQDIMGQLAKNGMVCDIFPKNILDPRSDSALEGSAVAHKNEDSKGQWRPIVLVWNEAMDKFVLRIDKTANGLSAEQLRIGIYAVCSFACTLNLGVEKSKITCAYVYDYTISDVLKNEIRKILKV